MIRATSPRRTVCRGANGLSFTMILRWLRRWRERDDQHLVKRDAPLPADPIDELRRIANEAQERDAADERRFYPLRRRPTSYRRRRLDR